MMEDLLTAADLDLDFDVDTCNLDFLPDDFEFEFNEDDFENVIPDLAALIRLEQEDEAAEAAAAVAAVAAAEKAEKAMKESEEMEFSYDLELEANTFFTDEHQFSNNFAGSFKDNSFKDNFLKDCPVLNELFNLNEKANGNNIESESVSAGKSDVKNCNLQHPLSPSESIQYDSGIESNCSTPIASPAPSVTICNDSYENQSYLSDGNSLDGSNSSFDCVTSADETFNFGGFNSFYSIDKHNNLVQQPLNSLTPEEMVSLSAAFANAGVSFTPSPVITTEPRIVSSQRRQKRAKGVSLLAKPPKSIKAVKREMEQSKLKKQQLKTTIEIIKSKCNEISMSSVSPSLLHQDHDYCSEVRVLN